MMKKYLAIGALAVLLSACTNPIAPNGSSFESLYKKKLDDKTAAVETFYQDLGLDRYQKTTDGVLTANLSVPNLLSGALSANFDGLGAGRDARANFRNIKLNFASLASSGAITVDEIGIITKLGDSYVMFKNIADAGMIPPEAQAILKKYEGAWLNINDTSTMSESERMGYNIGKNLVLKWPKETMQYFKDYPVFKEVADRGMSGSLHLWAVDLHRDNIVALAKKLTLDYSGTGLTDADVKALQNNLATVSFSGVIGFDPSNIKNTMMDGAFVSSGTTVMVVRMNETPKALSLRLESPEAKGALVLDMNTVSDNESHLVVSVEEAGKKQGTLNGKLIKDGGKLKELSVELSSEGMAVTMNHKVDGDAFVGKIVSPFGTIDWSGTTKNNALSSLKLTGTSPFGSINADLKEDAEGIVRGPFTLKFADKTIEADLGIQMQKEKMAIIFDLKGDLPLHFDIRTTAKVSESKETIDAPKGTKSFETFMKELEAVTRSPELPMGTDSGIDANMMVDPQTGMRVNP